MQIIAAKNVFKDYKVHEQGVGLKNALKTFIHPSIKTVNAITDVSFEINEGDFVGFIGENGAGKSTLIKMMSGILYPTQGDIEVNGLIPYKSRKENAKNIGVVFGQRTRLEWDLPMTDTFALYKELYKLPEAQFKKNVDTFTELLDMGSYVKTPVRHLSLGQRMRVEIALSMLHNPKILFLDEPTIGLDVVGKKYIRDFFQEINKTNGTTIILTSHDMKDFDAIARRIILLNKGQIIFEGTLDELRSRFSVQSEVVFTYTTPVQAENGIGTLSPDGHQLTVTFDPKTERLPDIVSAASGRGELVDFNVKSKDIEDIVRSIYGSEKQAAV